MGPSNSDSSVTRPQEALTSAWVEAQMRVPAQSRAMPHVFNAGNVVKQLIWTRVATYKGTTATVVAVQLNELTLRDLRPNALGEIVAEDDIVKPYFDIVVQLDDGSLAMCTGFPSTISNDIELAS